MSLPRVLLVLAFAALSVALADGQRLSAAGEGSVHLSPASATAHAGATVPVSVIVEPPDASLAAWAIEVRYDPNVLEVPMVGGHPDCTKLAVPPGFVAAFSCGTRNADTSDALDDTAVATGAMLETRTELGSTITRTAATFNFRVVGAPGSSTQLTTVAVVYADHEGQEHAPAVASGQVTVVPSLQGDVDCSGVVEMADFALLLAFAADPGDLNPPDGCPALGADVPSGFRWGDVNCDGDVDARDALALLAHEASLDPATPVECVAIGDALG